MTDDEKKENPKFYVAKGYLKEISLKESWKIEWEKASEEDKELLKNLPNFNAEVFEEISGICVMP